MTTYYPVGPHYDCVRRMQVAMFLWHLFNDHDAWKRLFLANPNWWR